MALEELLPQRRHHHGPSRQEHEGNLGHAFERDLSDFGRHRRPPQKLLVAHHILRGRRRDCLRGEDGQVAACDLKVQGEALVVEADDDAQCQARHEEEEVAHHDY